MFAIIETGGKQYKVEKGHKIDIERLEGEEGETITIDKVLLINDGGKSNIGTPTITGAYISANIVGHKRGEKIVVFKMKAKKRYQKTQGHRQELTTLEILDIKATGGKAAAPAKKAEAPQEKEEKAEIKKAPAKKPAAKKAPAKKAEAKKE